MAADFPIRLAGLTFRTSEALYQSMRFPGRPDVQRLIAEQASPMAARMKSKEFRRDHSHSQWDEIRVDVMAWCLRLKLAEHWDRFGELLLATGGHEIVEVSHRDRFWGAVPSEDLLVGQNVLGLQLMDLRAERRAAIRPWEEVAPPSLGLLLCGQPVPAWRRPDSQVQTAVQRNSSQLELGL